MASHLHELLVRLFRDEPSLLDALAPSRFSPGRTWLADEGDPTVSDSTLASVRAADLVVGVITESGARENVIVEVQLHPDPEKVSRPDPAFVSVTEAALRSLEPAAAPYYTDVVLTEFETRAPRLLEQFMPITAPENYEIQFEPLERLIARGRDEGRVEGEARVLIRQLGRRFGPLDDASRARIERATLAELDAIAVAFADGSPLESILASLT